MIESKAFRSILLLSIIAAAAASATSVDLLPPGHTDADHHPVDPVGAGKCAACDGDNKACRLDVYEDMEKSSLIELVDFIQNTLDGIDQVNCAKCDTCAKWAPDHCKTFEDSRGYKKTVNYANLQSAEVSEEVCCTERHIETLAPTPEPIRTCGADWDCEATCHRPADPSAKNSRILNCQSCCQETCEDWQPFHYCPLSQCGIQQANTENLEVVVDLADFDNNCEKCCKAVTKPPTPPPSTCEAWAPGNCGPFDEPSAGSTSCPQGKVLNQNNLLSTILDCNTCTQPTCKDFNCAAYKMASDPTKECEVNLHQKTCCKNTCEHFPCHDFHKIVDPAQIQSTRITHENCCKPTCDIWNFEHGCEAPTVYDQSKSLTDLPKDATQFATEGQEKCCSHVCKKLECPPGLVSCTDAELTAGTCSDFSAYPKQVLQNNICPTDSEAPGCKAMNSFWHHGIGVWECCKCEENSDLKVPGIPVWDDENGNVFHCLERPKEERHSYCAPINDESGKAWPACRVSIGGTNFCHIRHTLKKEHPSLKCDEEWDGGINSLATTNFHHAALGRPSNR